ncbi:MAG: IS4 family transposase [Candidatus Thermoplasmatota archaeon]|nr:IS4 family transposase [Candidatus Thermoplasmatota archaeon]
MRTGITEETLYNMFPPELLREYAKTSNMIKRERKIDPVAMFWVLVLSFGVKLQRTLVSLKRQYEKNKKINISESSWYERFTPELVRFLKLCVIHGIEELAKEPKRKMAEKLKEFKDILIDDNTVIRLHESLANKFPATRSRKVAAGVKVGLLISAVSNNPKSIRIYGERTNDTKTLRIGKWIQDRILLIDRGFFKYQLFARIEENGGFFVSRLKNNADPMIVSVNSICRGKSIHVEGKYLSEIIPKLKRQVLDVVVEVSFKRRTYRGKQSMDKKKFRLIAILNEEEGKYHTYLTNIPSGKLDPDDIAMLYRARWDVELVFKELKSKYALDMVNTRNFQIVEAYIWIAILTLLVSRRLYSLVLEHNPGKKLVRYTQLRWSTIFAENSNTQLSLVLEYCDIQLTYELLLGVYGSQALDPHVNRHRLKEGLFA